MATTDEAEQKLPTSISDIQNAVETAGAEDESVTDDEDQVEETGQEAEADENAGEESTDESDEDTSEEKSEEQSSDETKEEESKPADKSGYRYSQFTGDGKPETYISNLEEAYTKSSSEGVRLNQELQQAKRQVDAIMGAAGRDADLSAKLHAALTGAPAPASGSPAQGESDAMKNPFLVNAESEWRQASEKEAQEFMDANPEVVSDPKLNAEVKELMEVFSAREYQKNGRLMTAGEAMTAAYRYLGLEDKRNKNDAVQDTKKAVAPTRPQGARKPPKTASGFTDLQLALGEQMGVSKEKLEKFAK